jgi:aspartyl/asparaginyl beta-hydroxylase (cupin superfamily)
MNSSTAGYQAEVESYQSFRSRIDGHRPSDGVGPFLEALRRTITGMPDAEGKRERLNELINLVVERMPATFLGKLIQGSRDYRFELSDQECEHFAQLLRKIESLPTVRRGLEALGMMSIFEWFWRHEDICQLDSPFTHHLQRPFWFFPGLRAKMFYESTELPWIDRLERHHAVIKEELLGVLDGGFGWRPYTIAEAPDYVVKAHDQMARVAPGSADNASALSDWNMYYFYFSGTRIDENCERCPKTTALLESIPRRYPLGSALFSVLNPETNIAPHFGPLNGVLRVLFGVVVPPSSYLRVGTQICEFRERKALVFDDSFEHQVSNVSSEPRVVLWCDIYHSDWADDELKQINRWLVGG